MSRLQREVLGKEITRLKAALAAKTQECERLEARVDELKQKHATRVDMHDADGKALLRADAELQLLRPIAASMASYQRYAQHSFLAEAVSLVAALTPEQRAALLATTPPPLDVQAGSEPKENDHG